MKINSGHETGESSQAATGQGPGIPSSSTGQCLALPSPTGGLQRIFSQA